MGFIIKNTSALVNTKLTDAGRNAISQGNFNISFFQVGDSEISYNAVDTPYNQSLNYILEPDFNAQNNTGIPQSNKQNVKYPFYLNLNSGSTYGIPFMDSEVDPIFNTATPRGFFLSGTPWSAQTSIQYAINVYSVDMNTMNGGETITVAGSSYTGTPQINDFIVIYANQTTGSQLNNPYPILTFQIQNVAGNTLTLDRHIPNFAAMGITGNAIAILYPSGMTPFYDFQTPLGYWQRCDLTDGVVIWNMNIPWGESPAGMVSSENETYEDFGSVYYLGTKEYLGYGSSGGTVDTSHVWFNDSLDNQITIPSIDQKAIAIITYTNNTVDNIYGEKFAIEPYDPSTIDNTGQARNFQVNIPWILWHKSTTPEPGLTLYIDPPNNPNNFKVQYLKSRENLDFNYPGIRYFHLWDINNNRVGKVFPDSELIVIDDDEIIASMSYKSNRNWTLPAPSISLITPNVCSTNGDADGILTGNTEFLYVTYRFDSTNFTDSLHCNYYQKIQGPMTGCTVISQDVGVQFGNEFLFMNANNSGEGYNATSFKILCQKVTSDVRPNPAAWRVIDFTNIVSGLTIGGFINPAALTGTTFVLNQDIYNAAPIYDLNDHIVLPQNGQSNLLNFGDEYFFYGNINTDTQATIYEMRFQCNLPQNQFSNTSNPTWSPGNNIYITEIGLYDSNANLLVISKLQSPQIRQGIQQFLIKLDF